MCGILAYFNRNGISEKELKQSLNALQKIKHRGPDGEGIYLKNNVALGHRRLSIIDTSDLAAQPFTDASGRYTIVFNGEIFNYKHLRKTLENKGARKFWQKVISVYSNNKYKEIKYANKLHHGYIQIFKA